MTDILSRLTAALSDRYQPTREIGAGGMATVYLAHDVRHDRDVAIKVLHADLAATLGSERFLSEIRTTARLQHPHILPLLDSGTADGLLYYVMPLVSGESLRHRLDRERQLPIDDAVRLTREVAAALEHAHRQGVIHRDIKPENILLQDGSAIVADFGIALAVQSAGGQRLTQTGLSLGTPQYMSPEQATGERTIDARSDLYALGAVAYEMLAGEAPFTGPSVQAIVARLMTEDPRSLIAQRKAVPDHVESAVMRALEKLPADRFSSAAEFAAALDHRSDGATSSRSRAIQTAAVSRASKRSNVALGLMTLVALAAVGTAAWSFSRTAGAAESAEVVRYRLVADSVPSARTWTGDLAISPDGRTIVRAGGPNGMLLVRHRDELAFTPLAGTENAEAPSVSEDGTRISFHVNGQIVSIPIGGGALRMEIDSLPAFGGSRLGTDGYVYTDSPIKGVVISRRKLDSRDAVEALTTIDSAAGEMAHMQPELLPDGKHMLFQTEMRDGTRRIAYENLETRTHTLLLQGVRAKYLRTGHLLYTTRDGKLWVVQFDAAAGKVLGEPSVVGEGLPSSIIGPVDFAVSTSGTLVYSVEPAGQRRVLVWVKRDGSRQPFDSAWVGPFQSPALSPDGTRLAVVRTETSGGQVWVRPLSGGAAVQLTTERSAGEPGWRRDGKAVSYLSGPRATGTGDVYERSASGEGRPRLVTSRGGELSELAWLNDGRLIVRTTTPTKGAGDILITRSATDSTLVPLVASAVSEYSPSVSPDSKWLAYVSADTRQLEVYVTRIDDPSGGRWPVSAKGGIVPRWSAKGDELFYLDLSGRMIAVQVSTSPNFTVNGSRVLFDARDFIQPGQSRHNFDVAPDGRFLFVQRADRASAGAMIVVENFLAELQRAAKE